MSSITKMLSAVLALSSIVAATPVPQTPEQDLANQNYGQYALPVLYNVRPQQPTIARPPVDGIHMEVFNGTSQLEQVAIFRGIPAGARDCSIRVRVADKLDRIFLTNIQSVANGESFVTNIHLLSQAPVEPVTFQSIQGTYQEDVRVGGIEFANWDVAAVGAGTFSTYSVDCAETLTFKFGLRQPVAEKSVYIGQDQWNGYYLHYYVDQ
jgi:hypothetical protein